MSMLGILDEGIVHFAIGREFGKRYAFTFADKTVRSGEGFERDNSVVLGPGGVLLSKLSEW